MLFDDKYIQTTVINPNMLVAWYLMAAYAYYQLDSPILSDAAYDGLCISLDNQWEDINHRHKHIVDRSSLSAGTCLLAREMFPAMAVGAVEQLLNDTSHCGEGKNKSTGVAPEPSALASADITPSTASANSTKQSTLFDFF